jgi:YHS domain-containing protein
MRKLRVLVVIAVALGFLSLNLGMTGFAMAASQETCPVQAGKIDKKSYADYKGKRVYFCCAGCEETFKKDPDKYIKKLEDSGVTLESSPK